MKTLNDIEKKCTLELLKCIKNKKFYIYYSDIANSVGLEPRSSILNNALARINRVCHLQELDLPMITVLVVDKKHHSCGKGFYNLYREFYPNSEFASDDDAIYVTMLKKVKECKEWQRLADYLELDINMNE